MSMYISRAARNSRKLARAKEDYAFYDAAIKAIVGGAQQYSIGSRSVSKAALSELLRERARLEELIDALECPGRFGRAVPLDR